MKEIWKNTVDLFLDGEVWKNIDGYEDYQISNYGRIKSFKGKEEKIRKQRKKNSGYLYVNLCKNGNCKTKQIHVLLFESFNNYKLKKNECIHHIDFNKENNNLDNFRLMTKFEHNSFHNSKENNPMFGKTGKTGENHPNHKLTEHDVIEIRNSNLKQKELSKIYNVSISTISKIKNNKIWKNLRNEIHCRSF